MPRDSIENDIIIQGELRNRVNYDKDVLLNDISLTGIKNSCILNSLNSFHVTENIECDLMHDILLGVCRYDFTLLLNNLINENIISLNDLNERINKFHYGLYQSDKPREISKTFLNGGIFNMYASEMLTFVLHLPLMLGDLIPEGNKVWEWFLLLRELIDILLLKELEVELKVHIDFLIKDYLELRKTLFPEETLKPKHHYLLHYADLFLISGPIINNWCMRFEGKHRQLISYAKNSINRINLPYSLAMKYSLMQSYYYMEEKGLTDNIIYGPKKSKCLSILNNYKEFRTSLPVYLQNFKKNIDVLKWVQINGNRYNDKYFLLRSNRGSNDDMLPEFMEISYILHHEHNIIFICKLWETVGFDNHVHAYCIRITKQWVTHQKINLISHTPIKRYVTDDAESYVMYYK